MLADYFIGQDLAVQQLQTEIDACLRAGTVLDHALFIAPPGSGKSLLAELVAAELGAPCNVMSLPADPKEVAAVIATYHGVLILDEIHAAPRGLLDRLLPFLVGGGIRYKRFSQENERITLIAATTDPHKLPPALMSRFRIRPSFTGYSEEDIKKMISFFNENEEDYFELDNESLDLLAKASLNNPRQADLLHQTFVKLSTSRSEPVDAQEVLAHLGITRMGLRQEHLQYLEALKVQGGSASKSTISQLVFMPEASIQWIERDLLRLGIIGIESSGRSLQSMEWQDDVLHGQEEAQPQSPDYNPYTGEPRGE